MRQAQRLAETTQTLQSAKNHPSPDTDYTKKPHEKADRVRKVEKDYG
jgi:hypothetical protein